MKKKFGFALPLWLMFAAPLSFGADTALAQAITQTPPRIDPFVIPKSMPFITPSANFKDKSEFSNLVYGNISDWNPFKEYPFAGKIVPIDNDGQRAFFAAMRDRRFDESEELSVFLDSIRCFNSDCYRSMLPTIWRWKSGQNLQCNHVVSLFRTSLFVRGIISRPVYFEFSDNDGQNSHTLTETWSESVGKWLYFDPFYGAYSKSKNIAEILEASDLSDVEFVAGIVNGMSLDSRKKILADTFAEGWHQWTVPNMVTGVKFTFRNPKVYGDDIQLNTIEQTPAFGQDQKY